MKKLNPFFRDLTRQLKSLPNSSKASFQGLCVFLMTTSCSDSFMKSKVTDKTSISAELAATADAAGNYSAAMDPNSATTQLMRASSGAVAGSAIAMPAGALSVPVTVTIGQGETLASSDVTQQLGMSDNSASSAGPAVSFMPSSNVQASSAFTLSIPVSSSSSLAAVDIGSLNKELTVVMYKWMKVDGSTVSYEIGVLPPKELTIGSKTVQFQTTKFGTFQLAQLAQPITERIKKPTLEPPVMKADASNPLVGVWSSCKEETMGPNNGSSGGGSSSSSGSGTSGSGSSNNVNMSFGLPAGGNLGGCDLPNVGGNFKVDFVLGGVANATNLNIVRNGPAGFQSFGNLAVSAGGVSQVSFSLGADPSQMHVNSSDTISIYTEPGCYFTQDGGATKTRILSYTQSGYGFSFSSTGQDGSYQLAIPSEPEIYPNLRLGDYLYRPAAMQRYRVTALSGTRAFTANRSDGTNYATPSSDTNPTFQIYPDTYYVGTQMSSIAYYDSAWNFGTSGSGYMTGEPIFAQDYTNPNSPVYLGTVTSVAGQHVNMSFTGQLPDSITYNIFQTNCKESNKRAFMLNCPAPGTYTDELPEGLRNNLNSSSSSTSGSSTSSGSSDNNKGNDDRGDDSHSIGVENSTKVGVRSYVKFSSSTFMHSNSIFPNADCSGNLISRVEEAGTYTLGQKNSDGSYNMSIKMQSARATIQDQKGVDIANRLGTCGTRDWKLNAERDLEQTPNCTFSKSKKGNIGPDKVKIIDAKKIYFKDVEKSDFEDKPMDRQ
jgi:hypothetical protein